MVIVQASLPCNWALGGQEHVLKVGCRNFPCFSDSGLGSSGSKSLYFQRQYIVQGSCIGKRSHPICSSKMDDDANTNEDKSSEDETESVS